MTVEPGVVLEHAEVVGLPEDVLAATDLDELREETAARGQAALRRVSTAAIAFSMTSKSFASSS